MKTKPSNAVLCNTAQDRIGNGHANTSPTGRHKTIDKLLIKSLFLLFLFSILGTTAHAQSLPHEEALRLEGVPQDMEVQHAYRKATSIFYTLPEGKTIFDYADIDKIFMEPLEVDERFVIGHNRRNPKILINEVLNYESRYKPSILGHRHGVFADGLVKFYNGDGKLIFIDTFTVPPFPEIKEPENTDDESVDLGDGWFSLSFDNVFLLTDTFSGLVITQIFNDQSEWLSTNFSIFDKNDPDRPVPVYELTYELDSTVMKELVYRVTATSYSEVFTQNGQGAKPTNVPLIQQEVPYQMMEIIPNPATTYISIAFPGMEPKTVADLKIFNMQGTVLLYDVIRTDGYHTVELSPEWTSGVYMVLAHSYGKVWVGKFIKK